MVKPGIDVLMEKQLGLLKGRRVGLVANQSSVTSDLTHTVDALLSVGIRPSSVFSPEHGLWGMALPGEKVESTLYPRTCIPVYSLYGDSRKPSEKSLSDLDVVVFDVQDVGARYYTYTQTMLLVMEACAESGKRFVVLDRVNPITGRHAEGNRPDERFQSFVCTPPLPNRHGMTLGELARFFNTHYEVGADLEVIPCEGWKREMWFSETGLPWVPPSPGIPTPDTALLYPGTCLIEGVNVSEGRGTSKPFEVLGAPFIDAHRLAEALNYLDLPGVRFRPVYFTPLTSKYVGEQCAGVQVHITDRDEIRPAALGLYLIKTLHDLYAGHLEFLHRDGQFHLDALIGEDSTRPAILAGADVQDITRDWPSLTAEFEEMARPYLLYDWRSVERGALSVERRR